jgi:hypothetical protein
MKPLNRVEKPLILDRKQMKPPARADGQANSSIRESRFESR